jgi:hypothetical protein
MSIFHPCTKCGERVRVGEGVWVNNALLCRWCYHGEREGPAAGDVPERDPGHLAGTTRSGSPSGGFDT